MPETLPKILPDPPLLARRRKLGLSIAVLIGIAMEVRSEFFGSARPDAMSYVATAFTVAGNVVAVFGFRTHQAFLVRPARPGWRSRLGRLVRRGPGGGAYGRGAAAGAGYAPGVPGHGPATADHWLALRTAARLMPRAAGRRWLAEAASLLSEVDPGLRRGAARSYLRSAPRLVLLTWMADLARRARRRLR